MNQKCGFVEIANGALLAMNTNYTICGNEKWNM